jgi:hypothetical protein
MTPREAVVERPAHVAGFEAPIYRGIWERVLSLGVPRAWMRVWLGLCLIAALHLLYGGRPKLLVLPAVLWGLGHLGLVLLTSWDGHWDEIMLAHLRKHGKRIGYADFYDV